MNIDAPRTECRHCQGTGISDSPAPDETPCSRILITLAITDPEAVEDYKDICDDLVWEDLVNGELINFAELVSRENDQALFKVKQQMNTDTPRTDAAEFPVMTTFGS